jgi:Sulfotransferase domain
VTDAPCANLAEELMAAYPNAKVVDRWLASMETSYYDILGWRWLQMLATVSTVRVLALLIYSPPAAAYMLNLAASV